LDAYHCIGDEMSEENISIALNGEGLREDIVQIGQDASVTTEKINTQLTEAELRSDLAWMQTVQTVQKMTSLITRTLNLAGVSLGRVGAGVFSVTNQAAAVLIPLFSAQTLSGWQTAQAALGIIELGVAIAELPYLIEETNNAADWSNAFLTETNSGIYSNHNETG